MTAREVIYSQIEAERQRQIRKWGGAARDDQHRPGKWLRLLAEHRDRAIRDKRRPDAFRHQLVVIAALCVAAVEAHDRGQTPSTRERIP